MEMDESVDMVQLFLLGQGSLNLTSSDMLGLRPTFGKHSNCPYSLIHYKQDQSCWAVRITVRFSYLKWILHSVPLFIIFAGTGGCVVDLLWQDLGNCRSHGFRIVIDWDSLGSSDRLESRSEVLLAATESEVEVGVASLEFSVHHVLRLLREGTR